MSTSSRITFTSWGSQKVEREKGAENIFEGIMAENYFNLRKETYPDPGRHYISK